MIFRAEHAAVDLLVAFAARRARHAKVARIHKPDEGRRLVVQRRIRIGRIGRRGEDFRLARWHVRALLVRRIPVAAVAIDAG